MIYKLIIEYKDGDKIDKIIKANLMDRVYIMKNEEKYIINIGDYLYVFKENEIISYSVERI